MQVGRFQPRVCACQKATPNDELRLLTVETSSCLEAGDSARLFRLTHVNHELSGAL